MWPLARDDPPSATGPMSVATATRRATPVGFEACGRTSASDANGTARAAPLVAADRRSGRRLTLLPRGLAGGKTMICDKGYAGRELANAVAELGPLVLR